MATVHREANWGARPALSRRPVQINAGHIEPVHIDDVDAVLNAECPTIEVAATLPEARNVTVVAVTNDPELRAALAQVIPKQALQFSDSPEQVLARSVPSNCAVLVVEQSLGRAMFEHLKSHIKKSAPAAVDIMIGTYEDGGMLVRMLAAGQIDRFMVKPLNLGPARTALRSALQQHHSLRANLKVERANSEPKSESGSRTAQSLESIKANQQVAESNAEPFEVVAYQVGEAQPKWRSPTVTFAGAAAIALMGLGAWFMSTRLPDASDNAVVNKVVAGHLATAQRAFDLGSYVDPPELSAVHFYNAVLELDPSNERARSGLDAVVERLMEDAKRFIAGGDLLRAQSMLDNVRRLRPNHRDLSTVTASLLSARDAERQTIQTALAAAQAVPDTRPSLALPPVIKKPVATRAAEVASANKPKIATANNLPLRPPISRDLTTRLHESAISRISESSVTHTEETATVENRQIAGAPPIVANDEVATRRVATVVSEQPSPATTLPSPSESVAPLAIPAATAPSTLATTLANGKLTLIKYVAPVYPVGLRGQKGEGWVDVTFVVTADGRVVEPQIKNGTLGTKFHRAAFDAVTQWKFSGAPNGDRPNQPVVVHLEFRTPK